MESTSISPTAAPVPTPAPVPADALCPRCKHPLADPRGLGWCQSCGYCRSLEEDKARLPLDGPAEAAAKVVTGPVASGGSPVWAIVLFIGVALLIGGSFAASRHYSPNALQRASWASIQILAGIAIMF